MNLVERARIFATAAHGALDHRRKYTGEPYTEHLEEVVSYVRTVSDSNEMLAAAWLHDVLEDTQVSERLLRAHFPQEVVALVMWLTDVSKPEDGNRAARKRLDADHIAAAPPDAQTIKYADLISNTRSIFEHDPNFARVYLNEKRYLLWVATKGNFTLWQTARMMCDGFGL